MICVLVEEEWLVKQLLHDPGLHYLQGTCTISFHKCWWAFGSNHQKSRHFQMPTCVLTWSRNIWVVDWEMWFSADHWVNARATACKSPPPGSAPWFFGLTQLALLQRLHVMHREFSSPPLPTRMDSLWGKWWLFPPGYYICWMNEVFTMYISTCESKVVPCTEKKHDKYWMNIHVGE